MTDLLYAPVSLLGGFLLAFTIIPAGAIVSHLVRRKEGYLPFLFFAATFINAATLINNGRNMFSNSVEESFDILAPSATPISNAMWIVWLARLNMALFSYAVCQRLFRIALKRSHIPDIPYFLIFAFLFYIICTVFFPAFLGTHPSFEHGYFYLLMAGVASLFFSKGEEIICIKAARNAFLIFLILGASYIPWKPEFVFSNNYIEGVIPGLTWRYAGLATHANHLGVYLVLFMLCLWSQPYPNRLLNSFAWFMAIMSLILAQSKTCWISTIFSMLCLSYYHYGDLVKNRLTDFKKPFLPAFMISSVMIVATVIAGFIMVTPIGSKLEAFFTTRAGSDMMSLTGRNIIWAIAVNEWRDNPLFGYGLTLWDDAHRAKIGMPHATSAHNQFYETLGSAGIVGVIGLILYVTTLFWFSLKTARSSQGMTLAIFFTLFIRSASEATLPVIKHFGPDGMTHVLLLMIIGAQYTSQSIKKKRENYSSPSTTQLLQKNS